MSSVAAAAPFEPNRFPLAPGVQLLEASAGTGKTFALAHLVLRLVVERQLPMGQLLVVTFTEAAAAELRDRIAQRLQQALSLIETRCAKADAVLQEWLELQPAAVAARQHRRGLLLQALEDLDRADITTIHGFCRRSLQRQALEAGLGPAVELEQDDGARRTQVCHDYWQQQVLPLAPGWLAGLRRRGLEPELLGRLLAALDGDPALELDPLPQGWSADTPLGPQLLAAWPPLWQAFCSGWTERGEALEQAFRAMARDRRDAGCRSGIYAANPRSDRVGLLNAWLAEQGESPDYDSVLQAGTAATGRSGKPLLLTYFHPGPYTQAAVDAEDPPPALPEAPLLEAIAALVDGPAELVLLHFAHWGRRELRRRRRLAGRLGFGELLEGLDPTAGDRGELLAAVAARYQVALIDEFQDTDPIQWRILETAFAAASPNPPSHLLVMVGDPKQAIYRFRGGELATYLQARRRADGCHGLFENRRSSEALVEALNALMAPGLPRSALPVPRVQSRAEKGELELPAGACPLQLLPVAHKDELPESVAGLCLQLLQEPMALTPGPEAMPRPLAPHDLCLLVSTHRQAEELRRALERRGLPSRLVSRGDVFASEGAGCLLLLLEALADPGSGPRRRLLAASPLLGWSAAELAAEDATRWDALADQLGRLAAALPRQGLLAAIGQLLRTEGLARLALGGRLLADLQQAAGLVSERMHREGLGAAAAADWLRRLRLDPERQVPEEHQLHSDAADSAIAVVTVHRSKGLEYPVVICPYLWRPQPAPRAGGRSLGRRWRPPGALAPRLDLHLSPHWGPGRAAAADDLCAREQEAERLAYVAATRARHLLVLGWLEPNPAGGGPLASWLLDASARPRELELQWLDPGALPDASATWQPPPAEGELACGPRPQPPLDTSWGRSSYSAWAHGQAVLPPEALEDGRDTDAIDPDAAASELPGSAGMDAAPLARAAGDDPRQGPLALFPRGSGPGEALHRMLERIDFRLPAAHPDTAAVLERELQRAALPLELLEALQQGLERLRLTPFGGPLGHFHLAQLPGQQRLNEMNFDLPLALGPDPALAEALEMGGARADRGRRRPALVTARGLAAVFAEHPGGRFGPDYGQTLAQLEVASRGFLTGSIDLVFCHGQRWWVADWKSNWLGERDGAGQPLACGPAHYGERAMTALMASHHYPLQAHLYLVALHRYLGWRLPDYRPERHLGGYAYVFLRGVPGPCSPPGGAAAAGVVPGMLVEQPPLGRLLALDQLLREGA